MAPKRVLSGLLILAAMMPAYCRAALNEEGKDKDFSYVPEIHGALRTRYEMDLDGDGSRFQVRNARVSLAGKIAPTIDYFAQTDLCDRGKMKILDAWGRIGIVRGLAFQAGQIGRAHV